MTPAHEHDLILIRNVRAGSSTALEQFLQRMRCIPKILAAKNARSQVFQHDELRDLAQEVFAVLWSRIDRFEGRGSLEAWAYRFCCNVMMNAVQRRRRARVAAAAGSYDATQQSGTFSLAERTALYDAMDALDPDEFEVVQLKHLEGLSFTGIASRTHTSVNSAKTRYYRGLRKLRQILTPLFREEAS